jgi:myosin heavy subunit
MKTRTRNVWCNALSLVALFYFLTGGMVCAEEYTPPTPLSSIDTLVNSQQDNGYGLGALIASQQAERESDSKTSPNNRGRHEDKVSSSVSAATIAARQARAARKQVAELQTQVKQLNTTLVEREALQQAAREQLVQLQAKVLEQENRPSQVQALTEANNQLNEKDNQLRIQKRQLDALDAQLALSGNSRKTLDERTAELSALRQQMTATQRELEQSRAQLTTAQVSLSEWQEKAAKSAVDLTTSAAKQDYVVGQSIASSLRDRLQSYSSVGVALNRQDVLAGISDGLTGKIQLKKNEMDTVYRQFANTLQQQVNQRMKEGEKQIVEKNRGRKVVKQIEGITYFVVKKGKAISDPDAPVTLSLTESVMDGRTLSKIPRLVLTATDEMPSVIREALPLLGEGSEIQAYALAKSVYGERPLPRGVEAFTVLSYELKGEGKTVEKRKKTYPK